MAMGLNKDLAWPIYVGQEIAEVLITTGTDDAMARRQAEGRTKNLQKEHSAAAVCLGGPYKVTRA